MEPDDLADNRERWHRDARLLDLRRDIRHRADYGPLLGERSPLDDRDRRIARPTVIDEQLHQALELSDAHKDHERLDAGGELCPIVACPILLDRFGGRNISDRRGVLAVREAYPRIRGR